MPTLPDAVIATRGDVSGSWRTGDERRASDVHWRIRTNPAGALRTGDTATVRFDAVVAPGLRLNDPALADDRRTKSELCLDALSPESRAGRLSARTLAQRLQSFDELLRWRRRAMIPSFSALGPRDLRDFLDQTRRPKQPCRHDASSFGTSKAPPDTGSVAASEALGGTSAVRFQTEGSIEGSAANTPAPRKECDPVSQQTIIARLAVWSWLRRASVAGVLGADRLEFDPCPDGTASRLASAFGTQGRRTPTLSPEQFLRLLGAGSAWIGREAPAVLELMSDDPRDDACDAGDDARRAPRAGDEEGAADSSFATRVRHLMAACAVVIGGFAARRAGEVGSLKAGCISRARDGAYVAIYIEKTDKAVRRIPVPEDVVRAVETLEVLSADYRRHTGEPWIFNALLPGSERPLAFRNDVDLPAFALASGLYSGPHALTSPLASHQLRRGWSIAFYNSFRLGSLPALQRMLRHTEDASTRVYVSEATAGGTLRLEDDLRARFQAAMNAIPPGRQAELAVELDRLEILAASGAPLDRARCEDAALLLLQAWRRDRPCSERAAADAMQAAERRAIASIRLGSQVATRPLSATSLLERAREHARLALVR